MTPPPSTTSRITSSRAQHIRIAFALILAVAACSRKQRSDDFYPRVDPIPVHVRNENFLDMNVSVVSNGISRRLGLVSGNSTADFKVDWALANVQGIVLT